MKFTLRESKQSLCKSCQDGQEVHDDRGNIRVWCHRGMRPMILPAMVTKCSCYEAMGRMTKHEAFKIGWVLETKKGEIGFRPPKRDSDD